MCGLWDLEMCQTLARAAEDLFKAQAHTFYADSPSFVQPRSVQRFVGEQIAKEGSVETTVEDIGYDTDVLLSRGSHSKA